MKKVKWILLAVTLALAALFLFATCRKTKALEPGYDYNKALYIDNVGEHDSNFIGIYQPNLSTTTPEVAMVFIDYGGEFISIGTTLTSQGSRAYIRNGNNYDLYTNFYDNRYLLAYVINIGTCVGNYDLCFNITVYYISISNNTAVFSKDAYYFYPESLQGLDYATFVNAYNSTTGLAIKYVYSSGLGDAKRFNGLYNCFVYDCLDYAEDTWSELLNTINEEYSDNIIKNYGLTYDLAYNAGYNAGYQAGYDDGYTAGQTAGYNSGYQAGYNAGVNDNQTAYDHGYNDGYQDGYNYGTVHGYDEGFSVGYNEGLQNGLEGATPASQTVTLLGSIFGAIGTVLSIQLFPGFSLGLLILVPLFFSVLGLILWIWRRN